MPYLLTGYQPAEIPPPGVEANGVTTVDGGGGHELQGFSIGARPPAPGVHPNPPELRVPGVDDRVPWPAAWGFTTRTDAADDTYWLKNTGVHVAQQAGHDEPYGSMRGEAPMYGNTWRLEPVPADTGDYIGVPGR